MEFGLLNGIITLVTNVQHCLQRIDHVGMMSDDCLFKQAIISCCLVSF